MWNKPYNQREQDPQGFYLSMAIICALVAAGGLLTAYELGSGGIFAVSMVPTAGAIALWREASKYP